MLEAVAKNDDSKNLLRLCVSHELKGGIDRPRGRRSILPRREAYEGRINSPFPHVHATRRIVVVGN